MNCNVCFFIGAAIKIAVSNKLVHNFSLLASITWSGSKVILEGLAVDFVFLYKRLAVGPQILLRYATIDLSL